MAQYTAYASYVIFFSDPADYTAAVAIAGSVFYNHCPATAKTTFGLTYVTGSLDGVSKGIYGLAPYGIPEVPPGYQIGHPLPSGVFLMDNVDSVLVPGQAGVPPTIFPVGPDMLLVWSGVIVQVNPQAGGVTPPSGTPIPQRRFIGGAEIHGVTAEGGSNAGNPQDNGNRSASRTMDGQGLQIRGTQPGTYWIKQQNELIPGLTPKTTWERFYVRVNTFGTNILGVWQARAAVNTLITASIRIDNATGLLKIYTSTSGGVETLRGTGTTPLVAGRWYLIDTIILFNNGAGTDGRFRVWINHTLELDYTDATGGSLDTNDTHFLSRFGQHTTPENVWSVDLDDWIGADPPTNGAVESLDSPDWQMGSHVRRIDFSSGVFTNYTGTGSEAVNQHQNPDLQANSRLTSSTALATVEAIGDVTANQTFPGQVYGIAAIWFSAYCFQNPGTAGRMGYNLNGAGYVYAADPAIAAAFRWINSQILYRPSGLLLPTALNSLSIISEKSNDANTRFIDSMGAIVEYIGIWGPEDDPAALSYDNPLYRHNARYANTEWGTPVVGPPTAPCYAIGGTYVGNGTTQTINLPAACHFLWIRGTTAAALGVKCFGASLGGHDGPAERFRPMNPTRIFMDSSGQYQFKISGAGVESNQVGVTYQYIAFCDPGMRFNYCGTYNVPSALASATLSLFVSDFLPQAGFIQRDVIGSATTTVELSYKGPGNGANDGQTVGGVAQANWGSFAAGQLIVRASSISSFRGQYNYSLWRTTDPDCGDIAVQITNYTGDGNALKVITLPLVTGRYPLLAVVVPHNGSVGYFRDPSHTGVNSSNLTTLGASATAIMGGGIDQLFVGITLNTNLAVYDVFVIMGDASGWNNGTFNLPNCRPKGTWGTVPVVGSGGVLFNGAAIIQAVANLSGIYTLVQDKTADTFYTGAGSTTDDLKIPNPTFKTGYIGG